jgi:hypothetical protein
MMNPSSFLRIPGIDLIDNLFIYQWIHCFQLLGMKVSKNGEIWKSAMSWSQITNVSTRG